MSNSVFGTVQGLVNKVTTSFGTGKQTAAGNMPGGGAMKGKMGMKKMSTSPFKKDPKVPIAKMYTTPHALEKPVKEVWYPKGAKPAKMELYTKPSAGEKGSVNASAVKKLKANPKRPQPLKRKSQIRLSKKEWEALKDKRKEVAKKYKKRSVEVMKEKVYRKHAVEREMKREEVIAKKVKGSTAMKMENCTVIYSVGPDPKSTMKSKKFRQYRKFMSKQLKCKSDTKSKKDVVYIYKVGATPVVAK